MTSTSTLTQGELRMLALVDNGRVSRRTSTTNGQAYDFGSWRLRSVNDRPGNDGGRVVDKAIEAFIERGLVQPSADAKKGRRPAELTELGREHIHPLGETR